MSDKTEEIARPSPPPFFQIDTPQGTIEFDSIDAIQKWVEAEAKAWNWLDKGAQQVGGAISEFRNRLAQTHNNLRQWLEQWKNSPESADAKGQVTSITRGFREAAQLMVSDHPSSIIAQQAKQRYGDKSGAAALAFLRNTSCNIDVDTLRGVIYSMLVNEGIHDTSPNFVSDTINHLLINGANDIARRNGEWQAIAETAKDQTVAQNVRFEEQTRSFENDWKSRNEAIQLEKDEAIRTIGETNAAFREQMKLQGPVDYWTERVTRHEKALEGSRRNLLIFSIAGSIVLLAALLVVVPLATWLSSPNPVDTALYFKFAAVGAIFTTIMFWVGRTLLRIYMSDRHLLTDAEERVAMIKTYLALSIDGKVSEAERAIVLAPIFRSAADGIVKDDGPDASLVGILSRAVEIKSGAR